MCDIICNSSWIVTIVTKDVEHTAIFEHLEKINGLIAFLICISKISVSLSLL